MQSVLNQREEEVGWWGAWRGFNLGRSSACVHRRWFFFLIALRGIQSGVSLLTRHRVWCGSTRVTTAGTYWPSSRPRPHKRNPLKLCVQPLSVPVTQRMIPRFIVLHFRDRQVFPPSWALPLAGVSQHGRTWLAAAEGTFSVFKRYSPREIKRR